MKFGKLAAIGLTSLALVASTSMSGVQAKTSHSRVTIKKSKKAKHRKSRTLSKKRLRKINRGKKTKKVVKRDPLLSYNSKKSLAVQKSVKARLQSIGYDTKNHWTQKDLIALYKHSHGGSVTKYVEAKLIVPQLARKTVVSYLKKHHLYNDYRHNISDIIGEASDWNTTRLSVSLIKKVPHLTPESFYSKDNLAEMQTYNPSRKAETNQYLNKLYIDFQHAQLAASPYKIRYGNIRHGIPEYLNEIRAFTGSSPYSRYEYKYINGVFSPCIRTDINDLWKPGFLWITNPDKTDKQNYFKIDQLASYLYSGTQYLNGMVYYR